MAISHGQRWNEQGVDGHISTCPAILPNPEIRPHNTQRLSALPGDLSEGPVAEEDQEQARTARCGIALKQPQMSF